MYREGKQILHAGQRYRTAAGQPIYKPAAYAKTGAPMIDHAGININAPTSIYELQCQGNKRYIGKTTNIERRMNQYFTGGGSRVTKKFPPVRGSEIAKCPGFFGDELEQQLTEKAVSKYGYDNVRGGRWVNSTTMRQGLCRRCGRNGHSASKCYAKTRVGVAQIGESNWGYANFGI